MCMKEYDYHWRTPKGYNIDGTLAMSYICKNVRPELLMAKKYSDSSEEICQHGSRGLCKVVNAV